LMISASVPQHIFVWTHSVQKCILCARLSEPATFCHTLLVRSLKNLQH
jgi:hypothetical protein